MTTKTVKKSTNEKTAIAIKDFITKNKLGGDIRIYFDNKALDINYDGIITELTDVKATDYFTYGNDETVAMSFEGTFYHTINNNYETSSSKTIEKFEKLLAKHGFYYEFGDAWNLSLYEL